MEARRKSAFVNASRENSKRHGSSTNDKFTASVSVRDIPVWPGAIGPDLEQTKSSWQSARFEHGSFLRAARQAECVRVYGRLLRRCVCGCVSFTVHRLTRATSTSPNHLINSSPSAISHDRRISRASSPGRPQRLFHDGSSNERMRFVLQTRGQTVGTRTGLVFVKFRE